jgi:hypothetical protein
MSYRKLLAGGIALSVAVGGSTAALAATHHHRSPKRETIDESGGTALKPNRYVKDKLRWKKDVYHVRHGGTLHVVANVEGPHTFTVVRKKVLPRTAKQAFNCKACNKLIAAHGADPNSNAPPKFLFLENGVGQDTPPNVNRPGDSAVVGIPGRSVDLHVTAKNGTVLHFMCLIHPWMQAKVVVSRRF